MTHARRRVLGILVAPRLSTLAAILRIVLGLVLVYAGMVKIRMPVRFYEDVLAYEVVGASGGSLIAAIIPWIEVVLGACIVFHLAIGGSLILAVILFALFCGAQTWAMIEGLQVSCGCFRPGGGVSEVNGWSLFRTGALALGALCLLLRELIKYKECQK